MYVLVATAWFHHLQLGGVVQYASLRQAHVILVRHDGVHCRVLLAPKTIGLPVHVFGVEVAELGQKRLREGRKERKKERKERD